MDSLLSLTVNTLKWMTWPSLPCSVWVWTSLDLYVTFCISGSEVVIHYLEKMTQNSLPCFIHALSFSLSLSPSSPPPQSWAVWPTVPTLSVCPLAPPPALTWPRLPIVTSLPVLRGASVPQDSPWAKASVFPTASVAAPTWIDTTLWVNILK